MSRYVVANVIIQGRSMVPTLRDGDHYLLNRLIFFVREPQRGDLVVIRDAGHADLAVKRIVGMPGEELQVRQGQVWINGNALEESYLSKGTRTFTLEKHPNSVAMGKDQYFVLGDNRASSEDSRSYGPLFRHQIVGLLMK